MWMRKSQKPWRGPLPKPRSPHNQQLGDLLVKDLRFSSPNVIVRCLKDLCYLRGRHIDFHLDERERGKTGPGSM